ncbi:MAG: hypothetical protein K5987_03530 [Lachnospiraceae bacterium]|nr:hypothetical protein [Lachnospiraceae bacterium]
MIKKIKKEIKHLKETERDLYYFIILKIFDLCIKAFIIIALFFLIRIALVIILFGRKSESEYIKENYNVMSDEKKLLFDYFKGIQYENIYIKNIYDKDYTTTISFGYGSYGPEVFELKKSMHDLLSYLDDPGKKVDCYNRMALYYIQNYDGGEPIIEISNFSDTTYNPELEKYVKEDGEWWIYRIRFSDWGELEDNFSSVGGICDCSIINMESIKYVHPSKWENIKYIDLDYYGDDVDIYEQQLKELFPDAEIHVGK